MQLEREEPNLDNNRTAAARKNYNSMYLKIYGHSILKYEKVHSVYSMFSGMFLR